MGTLHYKGFKFSQGSFLEVNDSLALEGPLKISINGTIFTITMRSPGNDEELIRGLLYSEDIYKDKTHHPILQVTETDNLGNAIVINAIIDENKIGDKYLNKRNLLSVASCGICGKTDFDTSHPGASQIKSTMQLDPALVGKMFHRMNELQRTFRQSGGSHAAAAFTIDGEILSLHEDIGRHNAVDKVVGDLLLKQKLKEAKCLIVSGRISYEIVSKCFVAGIPFLAAVSAPSSLAVDYSKELGITLMAFCREGDLTVYSHPTKLKNNDISNNRLKAG